MKLGILIILLFFTLQKAIAQIPDDYHDINDQLNRIEVSLKKGDKECLKEFPELLDNCDSVAREVHHSRWILKQTVKEHCIDNLKYYTYFAGIQIEEELRGTEFKEYINKNWDKIHYSPVLKVITNVSLERSPVEYRLEKYTPEKKDTVLLRDLKKAFISHLNNKRFYHASEILLSIGSIGTEEACRLLIDFSKVLYEDTNSLLNRYIIYGNIINGLCFFNNEESLDLILDIINNPKSEFNDFAFTIRCYLSLVKLLNMDLFSRYSDPAAIAKTYLKIKDSLKNVQNIKDDGYGILGYNKNEFKEPIDYYTRLINEPGYYWWIKYNAIKEILLLKDPRGLKLVAGLNAPKSWFSIHNLDLFERDECIFLYNISGLQTSLTELSLKLSLNGVLDNKVLSDLGKLINSMYRTMFLNSKNYYNNKSWGLGHNFIDPVKDISDITESHIYVRNNKGEWTKNYTDDISRINFIKYWYNHWMDWVWDEKANCFKNVKDTLVEPIIDEVEKLFNSLMSPNDSIIINSFIRLSECEPQVISTKISALYNEHYSLSDVSNRPGIVIIQPLLENLISLTKYFRDNKIKYKPDNYFLKQMVGAYGNEKPFNKYYTFINDDKINSDTLRKTYFELIQVENELLQNLKYHHIPMLEYCHYINMSFPYQTTTVIRIIDRLYSKYWKTVINDENELKHFLKKSFLMCGVTYSEMIYLNKFKNSSKKVLDNLKNIYETTNDEDIKNQVVNIFDILDKKSILNPGQLQEKEVNDIEMEDTEYEVYDTMSTCKNSNNVKLSFKEIDRIIDSISLTDDKVKIKNWIEQLSNNLSYDIVPLLYKIIDNKTIFTSGFCLIIFNGDYQKARYFVTVQDQVVQFLISIYNQESRSEGVLFHEPDPDIPIRDLIDPNSFYRTKTGYVLKILPLAGIWKKRWTEDSTDYRLWKKKFYQKKIDYCQKSGIIKAEDINYIGKSEFLTPEDYRIWLKLLNKLEPGSMPLDVELPAYFTSNDLRYMEKLFVDPKSLGEFFTNIGIESHDSLIMFFKRIIDKHDIVSKGKYLYNLLSSTDFKIWYDSTNKKEIIPREEIVAALEAFRDTLCIKNSDFADCDVLINRFLVLEDEEKISRILDKKDFDVNCFYLETQESGVSYQNLGKILNNRSILHILTGENFFNEILLYDLYLPVDISDSVELNTLIANYNTLNMKDLYKYYSLRFFPDLYLNGKLDFEKAFDILKFDCINTYGFINTEFAFYKPVIKLLEIETNTRLDINRTNKCADAQAWRRYMKEMGLVRVDPDEVPSFND